MKFTYQYKTSDGVRHTGQYAARSKAAVYDELRAKGIKAFGVEPAPGLLNRIGGVFGWRVAIIAFLAVGLVAASVAYFREKSETPVVEDSVFLSKTRRQIIGDAGVIEAGIKNGWRDVFAEEGERFLASFAVPGVPAGVRTTNADELEKAIGRVVKISDDDSMEAKQIKSMVEGMKDELRGYLAEGGTIAQYGERLVERQEQELSYYRRIKEEIEQAAKSGISEEALEAKWKAGNAELRNMGIRLVPLPADAGSHHAFPLRLRHFRLRHPESLRQRHRVLRLASVPPRRREMALFLGRPLPRAGRAEPLTPSSLLPMFGKIT